MNILVRDRDLAKQAGTRVDYVHFWRRHADIAGKGVMWFTPHRYMYIRKYLADGGPILPRGRRLVIPAPRTGETIVLPRPDQAPVPRANLRVAKAVHDRWRVRGPRMWAELHARALAYAGDEAAERLWLKDFHARIGCSSCQQHWGELLLATPPVLVSQEAYFQWTVDAHNQVNGRINTAIAAGTSVDNLKPLLTVEDARLLNLPPYGTATA